MAFASPSFERPERSVRPAAPSSAKSSTSRQAGQQYRRAQVETASPTQLVILLYDGAIRFCSLAVEAMQKREIEVQNTNLIKAQRILGELMGSLDREVGGEVAANLFALYAHMLERLVHANLYDDIPLVQTVQQLLQELRDAGQEADRLVAGGAVAAVASEPQTSAATEKPIARMTSEKEPSAVEGGLPGNVSRGARATRLHTALADATLPIAQRLREQSA
jgi:flagellar protein FliS